jgi:hypothetical protein
MNRTIRQFHRWLSIAFTAGVIIYMLAMIRGRPPGWLGLLPLLPLISLLLSGLYLFVLPYTVARASAAPRGTAASHGQSMERT